MGHFKKMVFLLLMLGGAMAQVAAQGFLRTDGKKIVNGNGENVILRGIGTGNWMLMEGYMMKTEGVAGTQHEIRAKLEELMGEEKTDEFFNYWLENHFTKADVDSMKAWGFNSVRVAMHYKWFTLPVEEEPIPGSDTWIFKGFRMIDNLLDWCEANEMYLILDLHGAPGGQGANADISDYDPSKPSLWESEENKEKTVALWRQLAQRYANEPWIGGYDLINETNWTFPEGNNSQLRDLMERITTAIREVDTNHIIFIEGNSFANDFSGLTPPWDDNLVYSFHKYWSGTTTNDLDWVLKLRDEHNVPLWLGESGENSNTWFTDLITTCEQNNIGWSWWPVKKNGINNVLFVEMDPGYDKLVKYWKGENPVAPTATETYNAVMQWAENHKIENCRVQYDVIDAMIRQPHTNEVLPFKKNTIGDPVFFSDFDLGKNGMAYYDTDVAYYGGDWTAWNTGWGLRNDGVDIETCSDNPESTNGYNVGWTETGEWMQYSMTNDSTALYTLAVRHASASGGSKFKIVVNGADATGEKSLPSTGGWQTWQTASFDNVLIPAGKVKIRFRITKGGSNLSYFQLSDPKPADAVDFKAANAKTSADGFEIFLSLNKNITGDAILLSDFTLIVDGQPVAIGAVRKDSTASNVLVLHHDTRLFSDNEIRLSYNGTSVTSGDQNLTAFSNLVVENNLPLVHAIPGKIEAEAFAVNQGFALENCSDIGGGQNTAYASPGDYLDYRVNVASTGTYALRYRVATRYSDAELVFQVGDGEEFVSIDTFAVSSTGDWQTWETQSTSTVFLEKGYYYVRLLVKQGEHNLNWFQLDLVTGSADRWVETGISLFPNPTSDWLNIRLPQQKEETVRLKIFDMNGILIREQNIENIGSVTLPVGHLSPGVYIIRVQHGDRIDHKRFIVSE